ncbi:MAG TPA: cyclopropane-fatty-acyl-phospholipid synthase family protein [Dyella sp.]|uniref:cyclopropane-fatty-acyl-phospholipid synthase family protein n=1 Tax=Dyella sp. TaxID=1869338 RepID=UPI002B59A3BD|nr:cyclopropane-fatty-acyl-phospholipid synthase family protein [Dyella sp.]HUB90298.1 cyclopropane-fatty-acyl-phospholipid synthase family protein [Dyella sp.]
MNAAVDQPSTAGIGVMQRALRAGLLKRLRPLRHGRLIVSDALGTETLGERNVQATDATVHVQVRDMDFYRAVAANGSVGAGEAYMDGAWSCDNLVGLVRLLVRNRDLLDDMETGFARLGGAAMRMWHAWRRNTRAGSRKNIAAHYDLGNDFFGLFLSPDLMYSSALWEPGIDTLEAASQRKLQRICERLRLQASDHVMEIGSGWGGFAIYAASHYGCRVTTTTISREQHALASARVAEAGLAGRVTVLLQDYRDLHGQYDKLVSIEMVEAIGAEFLPAYFAKLSALLKPEGLAVLQAITIEDHRYQQALKTVDFIKRFIFPGSFIPSIDALIAAKTGGSDLSLVELSDFGVSYAQTLQAWRGRFMSRLDRVRQLGFDERFIRMWEFYLAYCEGGFRERSIGVAHLVLAKPGYRAG